MVKPVELDVLDRQWIMKAIQVLRASLVRSTSKEMPGSEIYELRAREVAALDVLHAKIRSMS